MYKIKYYLWLVGLVLCFSTSAYSADNTTIHTTTSIGLLNNPEDCEGLSTTQDDDGDGISNYDECINETNPNNPCDPPNLDVDVDCDEDGIWNSEEECVIGRSDPCIPFREDANIDCDGDGIWNSEETINNTDPNNPCDPPDQDVDADCDGDGFTNRNELLEGTSPSNPCEFPGQDTSVDCDGDGLTTEEENSGVDDENTIAIPNGTSVPTNRCDPGLDNNNNTKSNAVTLSVGADCYYGFNVCAGNEDTPSSCGYDKASVWYKFIVETHGYYEIKTNYASFNHALTLFGSGSSEIACTNRGEFIFREQLFEPLSPGTYYIMITTVEEDMTEEEEEEEDITQGVFCIEVNMIPDDQIPTNQYCADGVPSIPLDQECVTGSNRYAAYADPLPSCNPYAGASVWYKFQTPSSNFDKIQISAVVNYSEVISVYEGDCGSLEEIACKLNGTDDIDDLIINNLAASTTYYVQISGNFTSIEASNTDCDEGSITISTNPDCAALENEPCNDYNPNTINDVWDANCICTSDCLYEGDICDDGSDQTINDTFDSDCNCISECVIGTLCDDGDSETTNDRWTTDATSTSCICLGMIPGACLEDIIVNSSNVSDGLFEASNSIQTSGTVTVNTSLELDAGVYIKLKPGFTTQGASFHGYIDGCELDNQKTDELFTSFVKHYPNPFKDEINLEFTLDFDAEVQIIISDVNGRTITHLPTENLYSGVQTINVSTEHWIAGVYFYQALIKAQNTGILTRATGTVVKM